MKTKIVILLSLFTLISCSSNENDCDCQFVSSLGIYVPSDWDERIISEAVNLSSAQKEAINNQCKKKCD